MEEMKYEGKKQKKKNSMMRKASKREKEILQVFEIPLPEYM